jgi:hypothetical protein
MQGVFIGEQVINKNMSLAWRKSMGAKKGRR